MKKTHFYYIYIILYACISSPAYPNSSADLIKKQFELKNPFIITSPDNGFYHPKYQKPPFQNITKISKKPSKYLLTPIEEEGLSDPNMLIPLAKTRTIPDIYPYFFIDIITVTKTDSYNPHLPSKGPFVYNTYFIITPATLRINKTSPFFITKNTTSDIPHVFIPTLLNNRKKSSNKYIYSITSIKAKSMTGEDPLLPIPLPGVGRTSPTYLLKVIKEISKDPRDEDPLLPIPLPGVGKISPAYLLKAIKEISKDPRDEDPLLPIPLPGVGKESAIQLFTSMIKKNPYFPAPIIPEPGKKIPASTYFLTRTNYIPFNPDTIRHVSRYILTPINDSK